MDVQALLDMGQDERNPNIYREIDHHLYSVLLERERLKARDGNKKRIDELDHLVERFLNYRSMAKPGDRKRVFEGINRLVVLVTHNCQLDCSYCRVRKYKAEMSLETMMRSVDLLLSSRKKELQLQFFGGEPFLVFDKMKKAIAYANRKAYEKGKNLGFIITTNGIALDNDKTIFLRKYNVTIELSLDGSAEAQASQRKSFSPDKHYKMIVGNLKGLFLSGIRNHAIMVVTPENVDKMIENFNTLVGYGFSEIQVNYALGRIWTKEEFDEFLKGVGRLDKSRLVNIRERNEPVVLNAEVTVDCDGTIFLETGICIEEDFSEIKRNFKIGEIGRDTNANLLSTTRFLNLYKLTQAYSQKRPEYREVVLNNIGIGERLKSFLER